jgi:post-segregation antitoxin (ccd killing protein)
MWFGILTLATALILSVSAAYYSILGLTAIFAAAFWPIVILGSSLEVGKIVSTLWLHKYWHRAEMQYKVYLCTAVAILMLLTSMGVFGFLSKAHSDQSMISGDVMAKISIYDEKIKQARDNIDMSRKALQQMDAAVDQTLGRSTTEQGADKAAQLRRSQANERNRLLKEIDTEQKKIQTLNDQRAPIAAEVRKVEAEVGPIKYIAALIYGDNPEANVLEKAVRWVIILIVIVFDPLALTLLLAATKTLEWERGINNTTQASRRPDYEPDDGPLTDEQLDRLRAMSKNDLPTGKIINHQSLFSDSEEFFDRARTTAQAIDAGTYDPPDEEPIKKSSVLAGLDSIWASAKKLVVKDLEAQHAPLEIPSLVEKNEKEEQEKEARRRWKEDNPNDTIHRQERLFESGSIDRLPWHNINLVADNQPKENIGEVKGFGSKFPNNSNKGDMFLRVDQLPSRLYKFNGNMWIEVDKSLSDQHAYDDAYIDHLIQKLSTGEYDPDLLSDAERDCIEYRLKNPSQS